MTNSIPTNDPRALAILDAYRIFLNFYSDELTFPDLDSIRNDPDFAATLRCDAIDDSANAIHLYANYDTCDIDIIAFFAPLTSTSAEPTYISNLLISTDTMPYEPMILDPTRLS